MRDPRDVLKGRVEGRINERIWGVQNKIDGTAQGAMNKAVKAVDRVMDGKPPPGGDQKKKKRMSWWPFGGKDEEAGQAPGCPNCGNEVDLSWPHCPYCGAGLAASPPPPAPPGQQPGAMQGGPIPQGPVQATAGSNRTVAIDIAALKAPSRGVVGWIVALNGPQKGMDFRIMEGKNTMGAAADNDIVITDEYLSSRHSTIRYEDGRYEFIDADSTNGSYINEKRVTKEELIDNDTIRLGRTEFRFKALY
ncbi:MAG: FHA domain-containing protein [Myxococcales bacterium]|nr:FHA domain-containing protein [Myxococcales bacterium]